MGTSFETGASLRAPGLSWRPSDADKNVEMASAWVYAVARSGPSSQWTSRVELSGPVGGVVIGRRSLGHGLCQLDHLLAVALDASVTHPLDGLEGGDGGRPLAGDVGELLVGEKPAASGGGWGP